jgi:hypothetical protein
VFIEQAFHIAVAICPLVVFDPVSSEAAIFYFLKESGTETFIAELDARFGDEYRVTRTGKAVMVVTI